MTATRPTIRLSPPILVAVILLGLLAELLLYAAAGLTGWLILNAVAAVVIGVTVWLVRRRRAARAAKAVRPDRAGRAGPAGASGNQPGDGRPGAGRLRSLLPGLGRRSDRAATPGGGRIGDLLRRGRGMSGGAGRSGGGLPSRSGSSAKGSAGSGGRGPSGAGRASGFSFGRPGGGAGTPARSAPRSRPTGGPAPSGHRPKPARPTGPGPRQQPRDGARAGDQAADKPAKQDKSTKAKGDRSTPPEDLAGKKSAEARPATPAAREEAPTTKENTVTIRFDEDASLQRWGRNLGSVAPALDEAGTAVGQQAELAGGLAAAVRKLASQADTDLVADKALVAEAETIGHDLADVQTELEALTSKLRTLSGRADELSRGYWRHHEVDEARVNGERGGRHKEKRADVGAAEQDI